MYVKYDRVDYLKASNNALKPFKDKTVAIEGEFVRYGYGKGKYVKYDKRQPKVLLKRVNVVNKEGKKIAFVGNLWLDLYSAITAMGVIEKGTRLKLSGRVEILGGNKIKSNKRNYMGDNYTVRVISCVSIK